MFCFVYSILLHHGAPVNCTDARGFTPLFWASRSSSMSNIIELFNHGADINYIANNDDIGIGGHVFQKTPLFRAKTYETIKLLLSYGADPAHKALLELSNNTGNFATTKRVPKLYIYNCNCSHFLCSKSK